jgi:glutamate racemase
LTVRSSEDWSTFGGVSRGVSQPIGVFDSGVGGLAVLFELQRLMPGESFLYFADTLNCPWGSRPDSEILELATQASKTLVDTGVKLIVVACNSATTVALTSLRERFSVPFVGTEPGIKPAAAKTRTGRIGVMATRATVRSGSLRRLSEQHASDVELELFPCPDRLVELVERAALDGEDTRSVLRPIIAEVRMRNVDVLVLGCTHYAFLRPVIESMLGPEVWVLDTGAPVARQAQRILEGDSLTAPTTGLGNVRYLASSEPEDLARIADTLRRAVQM